MSHVAQETIIKPDTNGCKQTEITQKQILNGIIMILKTHPRNLPSHGGEIL